MVLLKILNLLIDILGELTQLRILFTNDLDVNDKKVIANDSANIILSKPYLKDYLTDAEVKEID